MNITDLFRRMEYEDLYRVYHINLLLHGLYGLDNIEDQETLNAIRNGFDSEDLVDITSELESIRSTIISDAIPWERIEEDIKAVLDEKDRKIREEHGNRTANKDSE